MKSGRNIEIPSALLRLVVCVVLSIAALTAEACAQKREDPRSDDTVPVWWADYRVQSQERGSIAGGGSAKHRDRRQAEAEALQAAERDLWGWMKRRIEEVALWFAQSRPRSSKRLLSRPIEDIVEEALGESVEKSKMYRTEGFLRSDGRIQVYVWIEADAREISTSVAGKLVELLAEIQPDRVPALVQEVEEKIRVAFDAPDQPSRPIPTPPTPSLPKSTARRRLSFIGGYNIANRWNSVHGPAATFGYIFGVSTSLFSTRYIAFDADLLLVQKAHDNEIAGDQPPIGWVEFTTGADLSYVVVSPNVRLFPSSRAYALLGIEIGGLVDKRQWRELTQSDFEEGIVDVFVDDNETDPRALSVAPTVGIGFAGDSVPVFGEIRFTVALVEDRHKYKLRNVKKYKRYRNLGIYLLLGVRLWD